MAHKSRQETSCDYIAHAGAKILAASPSGTERRIYIAIHLLAIFFQIEIINIIECMYKSRGSDNLKILAKAVTTGLLLGARYNTH